MEEGEKAGVMSLASECCWLAAGGTGDVAEMARDELHDIYCNSGERQWIYYISRCPLDCQGMLASWRDFVRQSNI